MPCSHFIRYFILYHNLIDFAMFSFKKIINACIDELIETEDVKLYPKESNELFTKHSIILRKSSLNNLEKLKDKYGISVYKLIHIAIKNVLLQYHEEKG